MSPWSDPVSASISCVSKSLFLCHVQRPRGTARALPSPVQASCAHVLRVETVEVVSHGVCWDRPWPSVGFLSAVSVFHHILSKPCCLGLIPTPIGSISNRVVLRTKPSVTQGRDQTSWPPECVLHVAKCRCGEWEVMALSVSETTGYERLVFYGTLKEAVCPQDHAGRLALWYRPETPSHPSSETPCA